jgi:hypothetical protein
MGNARVALTVTVTALVLAGCVARSGGMPKPATADGRAIGLDYPSSGDELNPCSLTGPAAFEPYGTAVMPGLPDLDNCRVRVTTDQGAVFVWVGEQTLTQRLPDGATEIADLGRGARILRVGDTCDAALAFDTDHAILATVTPAGQESPPRDVLCALTRGAAEGVFNVLAGGRARFWTPPPDSLANLDACETLSWPLVAGQLGLDHEEPTKPVTGHRCEWGATEDTQAVLAFVVAASADLRPTDPPETIAGKESWVVAAGASCTVFTGNIEFGLHPDSDEFTALTVTMTTTGDPCAAARTLAADAWPKLPT